MAEDDIALGDVITSTTDEWQYRFVCLKMAHLMAESTGVMDTDAIIDRAGKYWQFILGVNPDAVLASVRKVLEETKGSA